MIKILSTLVKFIERKIQHLDADKIERIINLLTHAIEELRDELKAKKQKTMSNQELKTYLEDIKSTKKSNQEHLSKYGENPLQQPKFDNPLHQTIFDATEKLVQDIGLIDYPAKAATGEIFRSLVYWNNLQKDIANQQKQHTNETTN